MASTGVAVRVAVTVAIAAIAVGCGSLRATEPSESIPTVTAPDVVAVSPGVQEALGEQAQPLVRDSAKRKARRLTLRVRNVTCVGVATGSGFAITQDLLITNRHVLAEASALEINTWNGKTLQVSAAAVGALGDVGFAQVDGRLPGVAKLATRKAAANDPVTVVGYPLGGPLTIAAGTVVDRVDGTDYAIPGDVLRLNARVKPGNSGGPVLNRNGRVVALIFAVELETSYALAIPVDSMLTLVEKGGFEDVPPC